MRQSKPAKCPCRQIWLSLHKRVAGGCHRALFSALRSISISLDMKGRGIYSPRGGMGCSHWARCAIHHTKQRNEHGLLRR